MKKLLTLSILVIIILFLNTTIVEPGTYKKNITAHSENAFVNFCYLLKNVKPTDLSFCLGYIKNSSYSNHEIANFVLTWSAEAYKKEIPSVFHSKIDRVIKSLDTINYQQLITDIDFIKNTQLTISEMVRLIKGLSLSKKN